MTVPHLKQMLQQLLRPRHAAPAASARVHRASSAWTRLADAADLLDPAFGAAFLARFTDRGASVVTRKRWELCALAQRFDDLYAGLSVPSMLGLGVGREPLIYHFANLAERVVATDLYDDRGVWIESRSALEGIYAANPFPYPRERLSVRNMDMRHADCPAGSFDVVWSCSSVEHVSTLTEFIQIFREIHRVLKPGGHALITTEFSLDEPYFLPGVLSLWKDCALFTGPLEGLTLAGPLDLRHAAQFPGNQATRRRDANRVALLNDLTGGPTGTCIHTGYTRLTPVSFVLRKTGERFAWPEHLNAPAWYREFSSGVEAFQRRPTAAAATRHFRAALDAAERPGARLHCFRQLIEASVHSGEVTSLRTALDQCAEALPELPNDDDALDLIAFVAAGQGQLNLAERCWERAEACPSALPVSRLRIRSNQLSAVLAAQGFSAEAVHLSALADAAYCEALDFHGPDDPLVEQLQTGLAALRREHGLASLLSSPAPRVPPPAPAASVSPRNPDFSFSAPPARPLIYLGDHLALTKTVYGHKMAVDTRSQVGACFLLDGYWEEWVVRHLTEFVKPGMRALDIGANMGFYTLLLADLVGPQGHVTAFEPWPAYYEILRRNVHLNGFGHRCTLERKAVQQAVGEQRLLFFENLGTGTAPGGEAFFEEDAGDIPPTAISVETVSVDSYLAAHPQTVDFIKIDVDGSEASVLRGMRTLLDSTRPLAIFCEFTPSIQRDMGDTPREFLDALSNAGFTISWFSPEGIKRITSNDELLDGEWHELLLVRG
jgi:FkbM family methyltransferase